MDAAIAGLIGGVVGAGASLLGLWLQQHYQTKRERFKVAADLGLAEFLHDVESAKTAGGGLVAPLAGYVVVNSRLLDELAKGPITPYQIKLLSDEKKSVLAAFPGAPK